MQHRAGISLLSNSDVQRTFIRRPGSRIFNRPTTIINQDNLVGVQRAFVGAARRNREAQRIPRHYRAEISAGSQHPTASIKAGGRLD